MTEQAAGNERETMYDLIMKWEREPRRFIDSLINDLFNAGFRRSAPEGVETRSVANELASERARQINSEGWSLEHDDYQHFDGQLARAAAGYAMYASGRTDLTRAFVKGEKPTDATYVPRGWPWDASAWKPKSPREDLVRAGALIIAEIERLDRVAGIAKPAAPTPPRPYAEVAREFVSEWVSYEQDTATDALAALLADVAAKAGKEIGPELEACKFPLGTRVRKIKGYKFEGRVNGTFSYFDNPDAPPFVNVQHDDGWIMHFRETELELVP